MMRQCMIDGCAEKHLANGYCSKHYQRMYKNGSMKTKFIRGVSAVERIMEKCIRTEAGCLIYAGKLTPKGYAHVRADNGKMRFAHVIMYEDKHGPVPDGLELDHTCRNRACCEEAHLDPVTHAENVRRGRAGHDYDARPRNASGQFISLDKGLI